MSAHKSTIRLIFEPIAAAVVLALLVRTFVHFYAIPSDSMEPTLEVGDHIVVVPYGSALPSRSDVIVFRSALPDHLLVKRIAAIPGDLIESRDGRVFIGSHPLDERYLGRPATTGPITPQIVPANCYFVLGDNRLHSIDSRSWGVIARQQIVGRARFILWSSGGGGRDLRLFRSIE